MLISCWIGEGADRIRASRLGKGEGWMSDRSLRRRAEAVEPNCEPAVGGHPDVVVVRFIVTNAEAKSIVLCKRVDCSFHW